MNELRAHYKLGELVSAFGVARSSYSYRCQKIRKVDHEKERLKAKVIAIHQRSRGAVGARRVSKTLKQQGEPVGRDKASRLMKAANVVSKLPKRRKRPKKAANESTIAPNLLKREFTVELPNVYWCGDITHVWAGDQWLYLAVVMDLCKRRIIGWACSTEPKTSVVIRALRLAYESRGLPKGLTFHSDQGCQYTSQVFRDQLRTYQMTQSMSRRGNCWDNSPVERFFRTFKSEWMPEYGYLNVDQAQQDIAEFMRYYNYERGHSYNDYLAPALAEAA